MQTGQLKLELIDSRFQIFYSIHPWFRFMAQQILTIPLQCSVHCIFCNCNIFTFCFCFCFCFFFWEGGVSICLFTPWDNVSVAIIFSKYCYFLLLTASMEGNFKKSMLTFFFTATSTCYKFMEGKNFRIFQNKVDKMFTIQGHFFYMFGVSLP
jgi:hypothetical protein